MKPHECPATRKCSGCGLEKTAEAFYPSQPYGKCRVCFGAVQRARYEKKREQIIARQIAYRRKNPDAVRKYLKRWYKLNRDHVLKRCAEYRKRPAVLLREKQRQAAEYAANREAIRAARAAYYAAHPEKVDRNREYLRKHYRENKPVYYAKTALRRSRKLSASMKWADQDAIRRVYRLAEKLTIETGVRHSVDHIVPLQGRNVCGLHVEHNLQVIPLLENLKKSYKFAG